MYVIAMCSSVFTEVGIQAINISETNLSDGITT